MFQIDNSSAVTVLPTPKPAGSPGFFTSGNPADGVPATVVDDDFMNALMMEVVNVVTGAGLTPNKASNTQLLSAIQQIAGQVASNYWPDSGTVNSYVITPSPAVVSLADGAVFRFKALHGNTSASTLTINALSPISIVRKDGSSLQAGDIPAQGIATVAYDATNARLLLQLVSSSASQLQAQLGNGADDTGSANAYICTLSPALVAHTKYMPVRFKAGAANTGASTLNPGPGDKPLVRPDGSDLRANDILTGAIVEAVYDGVKYRCVAGLSNGFTVSLGTSGYEVRPDGIIRQWGSVTMSPGSNVVTASLTFPIAFPNVNYGVMATIASSLNTGAGWNTGTIHARPQSLSGCTLVLDSTKTDVNITNSVTIKWEALGR